MQVKRIDRRSGGNHSAEQCQNLMLQEEVVQSIADGEFHVYPVSSIDEGIQLLTGIPAGHADDHGRYPKDTINYAVDARLRELAEKVQDFNKMEKPDGNGRDELEAVN